MQNRFYTVGSVITVTALLIFPTFAIADGYLDTSNTHFTNIAYLNQEYDQGLRDMFEARGINKIFFSPDHEGQINHKDTWITYVTPSWINIDGLIKVNRDFYRTTDTGEIILSGIPTEVGDFNIEFTFYIGSGSPVQVYRSMSFTISTRPSPTITLISDPMPTEIKTSVGTVALSEGSAVVSGGAVIHEPQLHCERRILYRWTDSQGNIYNWDSPVTKDVTLTADWRDHYAITLTSNRATIIISPSLPGEYISHQVDWGDSSVNNQLSHTYAQPGKYSITVQSGQWDNWISSSTTVDVEEVTDAVHHTIKFDSSGSTIIADQLIEYGNAASRPQDPVRDGYEFTGWHHAGVKYDWTKPVTHDITLTASWLAITGDNRDNGSDDASGADNMALLIAAGLTVVMLVLAITTRHPAAIVLMITMAAVTIILGLIY